jgi:hypothetical protein
MLMIAGAELSGGVVLFENSKVTSAKQLPTLSLVSEAL